MKALSCIRPGFFEYIEKEKPQAKNGYTLIKVKRIGICGTDLHAFEGTQPYFNYPRILGHELSGDLVESDHVSGLAEGDTVTIIPYFHCGACIACLNGKTNCCTNMQVCGVHVDGGMTEYLSVPSSSLVYGDGLSYDELAMVEPLAISAHGVQRAFITPGEFVLIMGAGPIGLGAMEFARLGGGNVIALDITESRLQFCKHQLKVPFTINGKQEDVVAKLREITNGDMPSVVIDATGNSSAIHNGFQYMAHGGRYILIGLQKGNICFSHPEFHKREATLMSSRNATQADFDYTIACIKNGLIKPGKYITHRVHFDSVANEFVNWLNPESGVIKVMVETG